MINTKSIAKEFDHNFDNGPFKMFDKNYNEIYSKNSFRFWTKIKI